MATRARVLGNKVHGRHWFCRHRESTSRRRWMGFRRSGSHDVHRAIEITGDIVSLFVSDSDCRDGLDLHPRYLFSIIQIYASIMIPSSYFFTLLSPLIIFAHPPTPLYSYQQKFRRTWRLATSFPIGPSPKSLSIKLFDCQPFHSKHTISEISVPFSIIYS